MATTALAGTSANSNAAIIDKLNGNTTAKATTADEMQTRFLNLLITQLKNQDPLNPTDANQMTAQLSQISTVSGIEKLNATMDKLLGSYAGTQNMQAAAMIGKTVLTAGNSLELGKDGAVGGVSLSGATDRVTVTIKDSAGRLIQTQNLGAQPQGTLNFVWDGKTDTGADAPAGKYIFNVEATRADSKVETTALQAGMVNAVTLSKDGMLMQLANNKSVAYSDILQILK